MCIDTCALIYYIVITFAFKDNSCIQSMKTPFTVLIIYYASMIFMTGVKMFLLCCEQRFSIWQVLIFFLQQCCQISVYIYAFQYWIQLDDRCFNT